MDNNVEQHHAFMPDFHDFEEYVKKVHAGTEPYSGTTVIEKLESFSDALVQHLDEVCRLRCQEIPTLESNRLRAVFTKKELADMESDLLKIILKDISFFTTLPMGLVCHDKSTAP
jgi:hypothetical protein